MIEPLTHPQSVLLATATVNPKNMPNTARIDPAVRMSDYQWALGKWLQICELPIVFCENSGADLGPLRSIAEAYPGRVEFLSFEAPDFPRHRGKGYGELLIFSHALEHSRLISSETLVVKVTGRLFIANFAPVWEAIKDGDYDVCSGWFFDDLKWGNPQFFAAKPDFLRRYMIERADELNESEEVKLYVEHLLAQGVLRHVLDGGRYKMLPQGIDVRGFSGTADVRIGPPDPPPDEPPSLARRIVRKLRHTFLRF